VARPELRVSLPEIFVSFSVLDALQLGSHGRNADGEQVVLDLFHGSFVFDDSVCYSAKIVKKSGMLQKIPKNVGISILCFRETSFAGYRFISYLCTVKQ
jgi:hypothetical protein